MKSKIFNTVLLIAIFIYLLYDFDIDKINISKFSIVGIVLSFLVILLSQIVLSIRWMKMSLLSFKVSFETIIVSSALNMILPAKLGEVSKAIYLKKFYNYSYHKTISIMFVERFLDVIIIFLLLCLWAYTYVSNEMAKNSILLLSVLILLTIVFFNTKYALILIKKIPFKFLRIYIQKIYKSVHTLFQKPLSLLFYSLLLWLVYFASTAVFFLYAVDFSLNISMILELFIFSTIALSVPLAPAGIGTYEAAVVLFLTAHNVNAEDALIAATIFHILLFAVDFILLYIFLITKKLSFKELLKK